MWSRRLLHTRFACTVHVALLAARRHRCIVMKVFKLPEGATHLATTDGCHAAMFAIGEHILCIQGGFLHEHNHLILPKLRLSCE